MSRKTKTCFIQKFLGKSLFFGLILMIFSFNLFSQEIYEPDQEEKYIEMPHSIYLELLGHGVLYSLNYEHLFLRSRKFSPSVSLGFSYLPEEITPIRSTPLLNLNFQLNRDFNEKHRFHFGPGIGAFFSSEEEEFFLRENLIILLGGYLGYKYSIPYSNWYLGITLSPFFQNEEWDLLPTGGLRVGYQFY